MSAVHEEETLSLSHTHTHTHTHNTQCRLCHDMLSIEVLHVLPVFPVKQAASFYCSTFLLSTFSKIAVLFHPRVSGQGILKCLEQRFS